MTTVNPLRYRISILSACLLGVFIWSINAQQDRLKSPVEDEVLNLTARIVSLSVSVTDKKGRPVNGLNRDDFQILDEKTAQDIDLFADEDAPVSLGIVIDRSGSMRLSQKMSRAQEAARILLEQSNPDDEFFLLGFDDSINLLQDFTRNVSEMKSALEACDSTGRGTSLHDAIMTGVQKLNDHTTSCHRALVVITDGADVSSIHTEAEVKRFVSDANVQLYTIGIFGMDFTDAARGLLKDIANISGGRPFSPSAPRELPKIAAAIASDLRHQYGIAYTPNTEWNGKWHKVRVAVKGKPGLPSVKIHARDGYYALPSRDSAKSIVTRNND